MGVSLVPEVQRCCEKKIRTLMLVGAWRGAAGVGVSWGVSYCAIKAVRVTFRLVLIKALAVAHLRSRCLCLKYIPWFMGRRGHCEALGFYVPFANRNGFEKCMVLQLVLHPCLTAEGRKKTGEINCI